MTEISNYLKKIKKESIIHKKTTYVLCILSFCVVLSIFWQLRIVGITMTDEACCGKTEHIHSEECMVDQELVCGFEEEHEHTLECYSDNAADVETCQDWEATLPLNLTGVWAEDLIEVAKSQLGYEESSLNFILAEDGSTLRGYTRYGEWYGSPYGEWSAMFASFCLNYADIMDEVAPYNSGVDTMLMYWASAGLLEEADYTPSPGDLVFFDDNENGKANYVGIVINVDHDEMAFYAIVGDLDNLVCENKYSLSDITILGYGNLDKAYDSAVELGLIQPETGDDETNTSIMEEQNDIEDYTVVAEDANCDNWNAMCESGYFEYWSNTSTQNKELSSAVNYYNLSKNSLATYSLTDESSSVQIKNPGGSNTSEDNAVTVSKTINGTNIENVFDITLQVQTTTNVTEFYKEPDMAVVIVMDISNTMKNNFGDTTRYAAAMEAAENFLNEFTNNSAGVSKVGFVAFNTDAHKIFDLQDCSTSDKATTLKNTMRTKTKAIIDNYIKRDANGNPILDSYGKEQLSDYGLQKRFTNMEAGLMMAQDMLGASNVVNENKYIIFLSDGFPTTYVEDRSNYIGYDTYTSSGTPGVDGVFYDFVTKKYCKHGTSYSDKAARKASACAEDIKSDNITIFSIGVDIGGQLIQTYVDQTVNSNFSVVDRESDTYEIGGAKDLNAYKTWLGNDIGSGYYYDSTNQGELEDAYENIFQEISDIHQEGSQLIWVTEDPMPVNEAENETVEFIGFYDKNNLLTDGDLVGNATEGDENTATFKESNKINWDLKKSGYTQTSNGGTTIYTYTLVYRVRLENEIDDFIEREIYETNGETTLQYKTIESTNGVLSISELKEIDFPIPSVEGYISEFSFKKLDSQNRAVIGAEFTLYHDTEHCSVCRGDGATSVSIGNATASPDDNGVVTFQKIASGHQYILKETKVPVGYGDNGDTYQVTVAYDKISLTVTHTDGTIENWNMDGDDIIINTTSYELPQTGGRGTFIYLFVGLLLMAIPLMYGYRLIRQYKRKTMI